MRRWLIRKLDAIIAWADRKTAQHGRISHSAQMTHEATMGLVVKRTDGTVEDLGIVSRAALTRGAARNITTR